MNDDPKPGQSSQPADSPQLPIVKKRRRTGFVAQCPAAVRDKIAQMVNDGVPYPQIIQKLGPDGAHLNPGHISEWCTHGGYDEWVDQQNRIDALRTNGAAAKALLAEKAGHPAQDAARTVAAAQMYELLLSFNPTVFATNLSEKPELYLGVVNALSRLSETDAACFHRRAQQSQIEANLPTAPAETDKKSLSSQAIREIAKQVKII